MTRAPARVAVSDAELVARVAALEATVRVLRRDLRAIRRAASPDPAIVLQHVAIGRVFTTRLLLRDAATNAALAATLRQAQLTTPAALGRWLGDHAGARVDRFRLVRVKRDRDGRWWAIDVDAADPSATSRD